MKKIQKPFNAEAAKNGAKVKTESGHDVEILKWDARGAYPIIGFVKYSNVDKAEMWDENGFFYNKDVSTKDLVIIEEVEETKFKEGDYIVLNQKVTSLYYIYKVYYIDTMYHTYHLVCIDNNSFIRPDIEDVDKNCRKWTLEDAKPGDVLIGAFNHPFIFKGTIYNSAPTAYCGIDTTNSVFISDGSNIWTSSPVRPATCKEKQQFFNRLEEEGYKWDAESLTLTKIPKRWRDNESAKIDGYFVDSGSSIIVSHSGWNSSINYNVFATKKQAKAALAMARISQIMANDERFGGAITDKERNSGHRRYVIIRRDNDLEISTRVCYEFLAFRKNEQAELFLKENEDLIRDYYMMD